MLLCGWLVPIHLRAIDIAVIQAAGKNSTAQPSSETIPAPALDFGRDHVAPVLVRSENRERMLAMLAESPQPAVQELLRCRSLTKTALFPPSSSASGQAIDVAIATTGLLLDSGSVAPALSDAILNRATAGVGGESSQPIEEILMDEMSLAQRLDWRQLVVFNRRIEDPQTLALLTGFARNAGNQLPVLLTAVEDSPSPSQVASYLSNYGETGFHDLAVSERFGSAGANELMRRNQRLYDPAIRQGWVAHAPLDAFFRAATDYALRAPWAALALKFFFFISGGFFLAVALQVAMPSPAERGEQGSPAGVLLAREILFASGILLVALLLSEPFLAQENQKGTVPFRLRLPSVGRAVASQIDQVKQPMNTTSVTASLLTLLLFFILQAAIYFACLSRLAETLRQNVPARVKLKLLENEEHLFDAGLYLGFVGTIVCLILVSLGVLQFSLMAAYSSTSFGIIFVSVLKIFKVRPARRRLLLEAESDAAAAPDRTPRMSQTTLVTAP